MKTKMAFVIVALLCGVTAGAQSGNGSLSSHLEGTWVGEKMNGLPSVDLKVESVGKNLNGTAIFYLQTRKDASEPWRVTDETPLPMLSPVVDGNTLNFEVRHHRCHGCVEYGPNVKFRMQLTGQDEARLWKLTGEEMNEGKGLRLVRRH